MAKPIPEMPSSVFVALVGRPTSATKTLLGISGIGFAIRLFAFLC